jgi:hypothetical protein
MKKLLLILSIQFCIGSLYSQNYFNRGYHEFNDIANQFLLNINNNYYYNATVYKKSFSSDNYLVSVNSKGQTRFKYAYNKNETTNITHMIKTLDGSIVFVGFAHGCDYFSNDMRTFIAKVDTNGTLKFENVFSNFYGSSLDHLRGICQWPDSSYFAVSDSVLFHFNKKGILISRKKTGFTGLCNIYSITGNQLLLSGKIASADCHIKTDTSGALISSIASPGPVKKYHQGASGNIFASQHNGSIEKISPSFSIIATFPQHATITIRNFDELNDTLYCVGFNPNGTIFYGKLNPQLNQGFQHLNSSGLMYPSAICLSGSNDAVILSNCKSGSYQGFTGGPVGLYYSLTKINRHTSFSYPKDIGVTNSVIDSTFTYGTPAGTVTIVHAYYTFKATVKNYTNDTVKGFYLNSTMSNPVFCGADYYHEYFPNVILPMQSSTVSTSWIFDYAIGTYTGTSAPSTFTVNNLCLYTTIPGGGIDGNNMNDSYCLNAVIPVVLGVSTNVLADVLSVSPNPFNSEIRITSQYNISGIQMFDMLGKSKMILNNNSSEIILKTHELVPGIYFMKIETERGTVIKKIVRE